MWCAIRRELRCSLQLQPALTGPASMPHTHNKKHTRAYTHHTYMHKYINIRGVPSAANSGGPAPASMSHTHNKKHTRIYTHSVTHTPNTCINTHTHTWWAIRCELRRLITVTVCADRSCQHAHTQKQTHTRIHTLTHTRQTYMHKYITYVVCHQLRTEVAHHSDSLC